MSASSSSSSNSTQVAVVKSGIPWSVQFTPGEMDRDELVVFYSLLNYSCIDIQSMLKYIHGYEIR